MDKTVNIDFQKLQFVLSRNQPCTHQNLPQTLYHLGSLYMLPNLPVRIFPRHMEYKQRMIDLQNQQMRFRPDMVYNFRHRPKSNFRPNMLNNPMHRPQSIFRPDTGNNLLHH
jgi:dihydroorotase